METVDPIARRPVLDRSLLELEQALEAGDMAKVNELAEALGKQQKEGHKKD